MNNNPIRLIVSDIDSTLIWRGHLPPQNRAALAAAHQRGIHVVLATVRKYSSAKEIADQLDFACPLICEGGATTYDATGQCVAAVAIATDIMQIIAHTADQQAIPLLLTSTGTNYATAGAIKELSAFDPDTYQVENATSVSQQHAITRIIVAEAHHVHALEAAIAHLPLRIAKHFNRAGILEDAVITAPTATKEAALLAWCQQRGLDWHDVLAIGDAEADLAMVQAARIGVAPANAHATVKAVANWVGPLAEAGAVAEAIQRFVFDQQTKAGF